MTGLDMRRLRSNPVDAVWLLLGIVFAAVLLTPPDLTRDRLGIRRTLTPPVSAEWRIAQRFRMNAPELNAIELLPEPIGPVGGSFRLTLRDRDARNAERVTDVKAEDLVREDAYVFRFEVMDDALDHEYQIEIAPSPADPGYGIALWATQGARPEDGALRINNVRRWGSLAYRTYTPRVSILEALLMPPDTGRPPRWLGLAALVGVWICLRFVLRAAINLPNHRPAGPLRV